MMRSPGMSLPRSLFLLMVAGFTAGCGGSSEFSDIHEWMAEVAARPKPRIEPLPTIETIPPFSYKAGTLRSPFEPPVVVKPIDRTSGPQVSPDPKRVKQFLEQFPIGQLAMVGTLAQRGTMFALVEDGDGGVHRVQPGDYMGTDHGQVTLVSDAEIELIEIVPDGTGGWVERARTVALSSGA